MTFARAMITAWMAAEFATHPDGWQRLGVLVVGGAVWAILTSDPLPAAIERALGAHAKKLRGR